VDLHTHYFINIDRFSIFFHWHFYLCYTFVIPTAIATIRPFLHSDVTLSCWKKLTITFHKVLQRCVAYMKSGDIFIYYFIFAICQWKQTKRLLFLTSGVFALLFGRWVSAINMVCTFTNQACIVFWHVTVLYRSNTIDFNFLTTFLLWHGYSLLVSILWLVF